MRALGGADPSMRGAVASSSHETKRVLWPIFSVFSHPFGSCARGHPSRWLVCPAARALHLRRSMRTYPPIRLIHSLVGVATSTLMCACFIDAGDHLYDGYDLQDDANALPDSHGSEQTTQSLAVSSGQSGSSQTGTGGQPSVFSRLDRLDGTADDTVVIAYLPLELLPARLTAKLYAFDLNHDGVLTKVEVKTSCARCQP